MFVFELILGVVLVVDIHMSVLNLMRLCMGNRRLTDQSCRVGARVPWDRSCESLVCRKCKEHSEDDCRKTHVIAEKLCGGCGEEVLGERNEETKWHRALRKNKGENSKVIRKEMDEALTPFELSFMPA